MKREGVPGRWAAPLFRVLLAIAGVLLLAAAVTSFYVWQELPGPSLTAAATPTRAATHGR